MCRNMPFANKTIVKSPLKQLYGHGVLFFVMMTEPWVLLRANHKQYVAHILSSTQFYDELQYSSLSVKCNSKTPRTVYNIH